MKSSIVNFLIVFGLKLSTNNIVAENTPCVDDIDFTFTAKVTDPVNDDLADFTCAKLTLLSDDDIEENCENVEGTKGTGGTVKVKVGCRVTCNNCNFKDLCKDTTDEFKNKSEEKYTCDMLEGEKKKKRKKICKRNERARENCPDTCDICASTAPTDAYVCEDSTYEFEYNESDYTCASFDKKFNTKTITTECGGNAELKALCPALCDNCDSASPSASSEAPSFVPSSTPTIQCMDSKSDRFNYVRYEEKLDVNGNPVKEKDRTNKKCKNLAKENLTTISVNCLILDIQNDCPKTCNKCDISMSPSAADPEPVCSDNDTNVWKYKDEPVTCVNLREMSEADQQTICESKGGAIRNCIETCDRC